MSVLAYSDDGKSFTNQKKTFIPGDEVGVKILGLGGFVATLKSE